MAAADASGSSESVTIDVQLSGPDWQLGAKLSVPKGPTRLRELLPLVQSLTDAVVDSAVKTVEAKGDKVSCKKGCGACCRQIVPISEVEASRLRDLVEEMPEPRRSVIRARFAEARQKFLAAGLLDSLLHPQQMCDDEGRALGLKYFFQGVACPFLEEESCSIYHDRPIACREYLVTSPAENCAKPSPETVHCVPMPLKISNALTRLDPVVPGERFIRWVPLIVAPEWAEAHPEEPAPRPGPELLRGLFDELTRAKT